MPYRPPDSGAGSRIAMSDNEIAREAVLEQLNRILSGSAFRGADRATALLRYLVGRVLDGSADRLKEYTVGTEALGRGPGFDPRIDPIVRAEASRLRSRLDRYYADEGVAADVLIELPKGTYAPRFHLRTRATEPRRRLPLWAALALLATVGTFGSGWWFARHSVTPAAQPLTRLDVQLESSELVGSEVGTDVVLAPDGSRAVFVSMDSLGTTHLRVRRFDQPSSADLPETEGARGPFWSPDGRWIGFWAAGQLRKVAVGGGPPVVLCDAPDLLGASWGDDGGIVAALDATSRLWRVNAATGARVPVLDLKSESTAPRWPQLLPGATRMIYTALGKEGADRGNVEAVSLQDGRRHILVRGATFGRYVAPGYLVYVNQGAVYAVRFDPRRLVTHGAPVPIIDGVTYSPVFGYAQLSLSDNGIAAYQRAPASGRLIVVLLDSAGRSEPLLEKPGRYAWPALSPDGRSLALSVVESGVAHLVVYAKVAGSAPQQSWSVPGYDAATWTRDGKFLVARGREGLVWLDAAGGESRTLVKSADISVPWSLAPGDQILAFAAQRAPTAFDLWTVSLRKTGGTLVAGVPKPFLQSRSYETYPTISPDGRWLAYASNESGSWEVYVRAMTDSTARVRVSLSGGRVPRWSKSSRRIYFSTDDQRIMAASYTTPGGRFVAGTPRQWTPVRLANTGVLPNFDLGRDDRHIVALMPAGGSAEAEPANHITLMENFVEELRRGLP